MTLIDTNWIPNSIHQIFARWSYLYVAHYTQGFRMLDISDPENIIELGYYDDFPMINFIGGSSLFFRQNWYKGIYGIFPDANRSTICYAGGFDGFYIFDVTPPPYPPVNLTASVSPGNHVFLQWGFIGDENNIDHYNIYKKEDNSTLWQYLDETRNKYYEDSTETILCGGGQGHHTAHYYVTAVSVSEYESNASNREDIEVCGFPNEEKRSAEKVETEQFEYSLSANYPNPFNPATTIDYSIKSAGLVSLKVYDMLGTEVATLVDERKETGKYSVEFNAESLPSGIYLYTITTGNFTASKKLILLR